MNPSLKRTIVRAVGPILSRGSAPRVVVICLHSIDDFTPYRSATPELFESYLSFLVKSFDIIRFKDVATALQDPAPRRTKVAITFDDGYIDNYCNAFPLLLKHNLSATFFVTVGLLERRSAVLARFQQLRACSGDHILPLEWQHCREMLQYGMDFGSHTLSHPNLATLDRESAWKEISVSKEILEQQLGQAVSSIAYPFGKLFRHVSSETLELAADAGYECGAAVLFRSVRPTDGRLAIPRIFITNDTVEQLHAKTCGHWDFVGWWQENAPMPLASLISPADFRY